MKKSLLLITDISGFTNFVQSTEVEHSQHVIAELLEVLINANTQQLSLAEIEGDALFFYKEGEVLSQEKLLAQIETMFTAFFGYLKMIEKYRICPCLACSSAPNLELKIIVHAGSFQFLEVQNNRKPFGESVIQIHRLLKNKINSTNYTLITQDLAELIKMPFTYKSKLYDFQEASDIYDNKEIGYIYSTIDVSNLKIKLFQEESQIQLNNNPNITFERIYNTNHQKLFEFITNYKYRHQWTTGVDEIKFNPNEVTRVGSEHTCVIGSKHLNFKVVTKLNTDGKILYGEKTTSPPPVDVLYQFFDIIPITEHKSKLNVELYWEASSTFKKMMLYLFAKRSFINNINKALDMLSDIVNKKTNEFKIVDDLVK